MALPLPLPLPLPLFFTLLTITTIKLVVITAVTAPQNSAAAEPFVGVCIGTQVSNILSPADLVEFLKSQQITHIRLYEPDTNILSALNGSGIHVLLGIPNNQLLALGSSPATAAAWVSRHVLPFHPSTPISAIAVGDDVPFTFPSSLPLLLPALLSLHSSLSNLSIPISTPLSFSSIIDPFPPSQAFFNQSLVSGFILPLLRFLSSTSSPLMLNLYPYYVLTRARGVIPLDNALFRPLPPSREEVDPNTLLHYTNVLDAMLDAAYFSMRNLNFTNIPILITETGWPSFGDRHQEPFASKDNADTYNSNMIKHVLDRSGTPLHPEMTSSVYLYELFDEDLRPGPVSEQHWGLFYGNATPVYLLHVTGSGGLLANDTTDKTYCVAEEGADRKMLQAALDWACGPGKANCSEIQPGESCYDPNTVKAHASYAFDSYYQKEGKVAGSCYFQGVAMVTTTDPSHGKCFFPGSKLVVNVTQAAMNATTQTSNAERSYRQWRRTRSAIDAALLVTVVVLLTSIPHIW
ncbi:glucan endo-1,3-beta-glucosidase 1-like isoform X1 [Dioscorea cayenensis subsp. rotundata]|uniref:glucan endo-1,3-beta-D-glucosidase n=1 Tax=Dioscorea cayennensis subsp. rotundata TaxID=55577 RepID=A0AB40CKG0_DIOCR|nr:glucan endo-1,3-beta-glucosidase 1-like isoform X1 [Dioscorea cayenensis subsp. rotundata]